MAMKKFLTPLFAVFLVLVLSSSGFGQGAIRDFTYQDDGGTNPPIRSLCGPGQGTILPDNSAQICLFWDNNGNGPDATDVQPTDTTEPCYGCVNYNCFPINGEDYGVGPGYFSTAGTGYALVLAYPPESPDLPLYYWRINSSFNGDQCCWTSAVYTFTPGYQEVFIPAADWTCTTGPCPNTGSPPDPATNVEASDDSLCLTIFVSWEHSGVNVSGFGVYDESGLVGSVGGTARNLSVQVCDNQSHDYYVVATNAFGTSGNSNHDSGSAYLLRFASGTSGNLYGDYACGAPFTIGLERPEETCGSLDSLFIIDSNNTVLYFVCLDSMVTEMTCTLPDPGSALLDLRLLLRAHYFARPCMETDTTDSTFNLCTVSAGEHSLLIPDHFALEQNYPNPFNSTAMIDFAVPYQTDVRIEVYNITGQLVKTLVSGSITAGVHHIAWDGLSDGGISVSSGLYFYRMASPGFVQTKKMLMLK
jgi:hypothetical protein